MRTTSHPNQSRPHVVRIFSTKFSRWDDIDMEWRRDQDAQARAEVAAFVERSERGDLLRADDFGCKCLSCHLTRTEGNVT